MEQYKKYTSTATIPIQKNRYTFLLVNILVMLVLPVFCIVSENQIENAAFNWSLIGKWFIFWPVGIRLFMAGIKQSSNPEFTASRIFHLKSTESFVVIRELGFANISIGVMGILSVINNSWRPLAAITGGLFFGLAGLQHLFKKPDSQNEVIAMVGDLFIFLLMIFYLGLTLFI